MRCLIEARHGIHWRQSLSQRANRCTSRNGQFSFNVYFCAPCEQVHPFWRVLSSWLLVPGASLLVRDGGCAWNFTTRNRCALHALRVGLWARLICGLSGFSSGFSGGEFAFFLGFAVCCSAFLCNFDDVLIEVFVTGTQLIKAASV